MMCNLKMLVSMYEPLLNPSRSITNKADAMQFAILTTMQYKCGESSKVDYEEAEKLFNFICDHVEFPVDTTKQVMNGILPVLENILTGIAVAAEDKDDAFEKSK